MEHRKFNMENPQASTQAAPTGKAPFSAFCGYSPQDAAFARRLDISLAMLKRQGLIRTWSEEALMPGDARDHVISTHLNSSDLIFLLLSPDLLASDFCSPAALDRLINNHSEGQQVLVPIVARDCDWASTSLRGLHAIPQTDDGTVRPISQWTDPDLAWSRVATAIRALVVDRAKTAPSRGEPFSASRTTASHLPDETAVGQWTLVLSGTLNDYDKPRVEAIVTHLGKLLGNSMLTLLRVEEGSVRIVLRGTHRGFEELLGKHQRGQLAEILGVPVEQLLWEGAPTADDDLVAQSGEKATPTTPAPSDTKVSAADASKPHTGDSRALNRRELQQSREPSPREQLVARLRGSTIRVRVDSFLEEGILVTPSAQWALSPTRVLLVPGRQYSYIDLRTMVASGDVVSVKIDGLDRYGRVLTILPDVWAEYGVGTRHSGHITDVLDGDAIVTVKPGIQGIIEREDLWLTRIQHADELVPPLDIKVVVIACDPSRDRVVFHPVLAAYTDPRPMVTFNSTVQVEVVRLDGSEFLVRILGLNGRHARAFVTGIRLRPELLTRFPPGKQFRAKVVSPSVHDGLTTLTIESPQGRETGLSYGR